MFWKMLVKLCWQQNVCRRGEVYDTGENIPHVSMIHIHAYKLAEHMHTHVFKTCK